MAARIKVLHIVTRLVRGGAQRIVLDLLKHLPRDEFDFTLVSGEVLGKEGSVWDEAEALGIPLVRCPSLIREISPLKDLKALRELRGIIREQAPTIVHAHTSKAGLLGCLAAKRENVPGVIFAPHGHILSQGAKIPGVPTRGFKRRLLSVAARHNVKRADVVIAPNEAELSDGIMHGLWKREDCKVIPNGVDTELYQPRENNDLRKELGIADNTPMVGVVARLTEEKGVDRAIQALTSIEEARLIIVGDGPERTALEALVQEHSLGKRVHFLGLRSDLEKLYPAFDLLIVPSRSEAHGLVAAEAMACQIPVVACATGGLRSLVLDEVTGLTARSRNKVVESLAEKTNQLIRDRQLARQLAEAGRRHIVEKFSLQKMIDETRALYHTMGTKC